MKKHIACADGFVGNGQSRSKVPGKPFMVWNLRTHGERPSKENRIPAKQQVDGLARTKAKASFAREKTKASKTKGKGKGNPGQGKGKDQNKGKGKNHGKKGKKGSSGMEEHDDRQDTQTSQDYIE